MPFPEFEPGKKRILFFSRGRGRGHAVPDHAIMQALQQARQDIEVRIVSYSTGAATFEEFGVPIIDLGVPAIGPIAEISVLAGKLIGWLNPHLVVCHEEFAAVPAAKIFDRPVVFLTDWFAEPDAYSMNALKFADHVLFLGAPGVFEEPPWLKDKVQYLGAILRQFQYGPQDRHLARKELGIPASAFVISVFPGSWSEQEAPILHTVFQAFESLPHRPKHLIWLAGQDYSIVRSTFAPLSEALVFERIWEIDRLMVAADIAITKTSRKTLFELQHLRVPAVIISYGLNPTDDRAIAHLSGAVILNGRGLDASTLAAAVQSQAGRPPAPSSAAFCTVERCAQRIAGLLDQAMSQPVP